DHRGQLANLVQINRAKGGNRWSWNVGSSDVLGLDMMPSSNHDVSENIDFVFSLPKTQRQRLAQCQHSLHAAVFDNGKMTKVACSHDLLALPPAVTQSASHTPRRHDVAPPQILQPAPV